MPAADVRHHLFEEARHQAGWAVEELWISYLALGGTLLVLDLDAYLNGLTSIPVGQQDVLACALNERLADLDRPTRVAYLTVLPETPTTDAWDERADS